MLGEEFDHDLNPSGQRPRSPDVDYVEGLCEASILFDYLQFTASQHVGDREFWHESPCSSGSHCSDDDRTVVREIEAFVLLPFGIGALVCRRHDGSSGIPTDVDSF